MRRSCRGRWSISRCGSRSTTRAARATRWPQPCPRHRRIRRFGIATLTAQGHDVDAPALSAFRGRQKEALELLRGKPQGMSVPALNERGISTDVLQRLAEKGLVAFRHERVERDPFTSGAASTPVSSSCWPSC